MLTATFHKTSRKPYENARVGLVGWLATGSPFTPKKFVKASRQEMLFRHF